jgi:hypothetical protein
MIGEPRPLLRAVLGARSRRFGTGDRPPAGRVVSWRGESRSMKNRRSFLLAMISGVVALGVVVGTAIADELLGVITKVDVAGSKIMVLPKDEDKEVEVTITKDTVQLKKGEEFPVDLEKLDGFVKKVQDAGKKGVPAKITHEKGKASKIQYIFGKKKAEAKTDR